MLAPTAAKVNAKSNDPLNPQQGETTATPALQAFLSWWDRHYDEISKYEPQYQKLNQIMKWSLAIAWLEQSNEKDPLAFLGSVKVNHSNWFPDWAKAHKQQLKFHYWSEGSNCQPAKPDNQEQVCFYQKEYQGHTTESMPLLASKTFEMFGKKEHYLAGGVSLAEKSLMKDYPALKELSKKLEPALRSDIDPKFSITEEGNGFYFKDFKGTTYKIASGESPSTTVKLGKEIIGKSESGKDILTGIKLRSPIAELAHELEFTTNISRTTDGIKISQTAREVGIGDLTTKKTPNGFTVGFASREIDKVNALAMDVSTSTKSVEDFLASHPGIQSAYVDESTGVFYTKLKNSEKVLEWTPEKVSDVNTPQGGGNGGGGEPPKGFARVGFPDDPAGSGGKYSLAWTERKKFDPSGKKQLKSAIVIDPSAIPRKRYLISEIDKSLQDNPQRAALMIQYTIELEGRTPSLVIRKAIAEIKQGQRIVKGISFDKETARWSESKGDFLHQINQMLDGEIKFKRIEKDDAFIYVQDTPGLNNLDWSQPIESSVLDSQFVKVKVYNFANHQTPGTKLSDLGYNSNPKLLDSGDHYEVKGNFSHTPLPSIVPTGSGCESSDDRASDSKSCKPVYVVIETSEISDQ